MLLIKFQIIKKSLKNLYFKTTKNFKFNFNLSVFVFQKQRDKIAWIVLKIRYIYIYMNLSSQQNDDQYIRYFLPRCIVVLHRSFYCSPAPGGWN